MKKYVLFVTALWFMSMTLAKAQVVKDADGNEYLVISIGGQMWLAENLRTTRLNDGQKIPIIEDEKEWRNTRSPAVCWYDNNPANKEIYGGLYNWFTVNTGKLCPVGWHVPSTEDWLDLIAFLKNENTAGDRLKESGTEHWKNYLSQATNDFDFSALPGGMRFYSGSFPEFGNSYAVWWTSSKQSTTHAWTRGLHDSSSKLYKGYDEMHSGFSVRCIRDQ